MPDFILPAVLTAILCVALAIALRDAWRDRSAILRALRGEYPAHPHKPHPPHLRDVFPDDMRD